MECFKAVERQANKRRVSSSNRVLYLVVFLELLVLPKRELLVELLGRDTGSCSQCELAASSVLVLSQEKEVGIKIGLFEGIKSYLS